MLVFGCFCLFVFGLYFCGQNTLRIITMMTQFKFNQVLQIAMTGRLSFECLIYAGQCILIASHFLSRHTYSYSIEEDTEGQRDSMHCPFHTVNEREIQKGDPHLQNPKFLLIVQFLAGWVQDHNHIVSLSFKLTSILGLPDTPKATCL